MNKQGIKFKVKLFDVIALKDDKNINEVIFTK